jgi:hypothetical protein
MIMIWIKRSYKKQENEEEEKEWEEKQELFKNEWIHES